MAQRTVWCINKPSTRTRSGKFKPHVQIQDEGYYLDVRTYKKYDTEAEADAARERLIEYFKGMLFNPTKFQP